MKKPIVKNQKMKKEKMNVLYHCPIFLLVKIKLQNGKRIHPEQMYSGDNIIFFAKHLECTKATLIVFDAWKLFFNDCFRENCDLYTYLYKNST